MILELNRADAGLLLFPYCTPYERIIEARIAIGDDWNLERIGQIARSLDYPAQG